ncbi:MAG: hypothetical protein ABSF69_26560 [Polyangiaceae bacterium]|jgi:hypothetical protein
MNDSGTMMNHPTAPTFCALDLRLGQARAKLNPMPLVLPPTSDDLADSSSRPYFLWWTDACHSP